MTVFEEIKGLVSAKDVAQAYGLHFGRNGRALCPWHSDRHPDLAFYGNRCYCHACHNGGDAVALAAQLFDLSMIDAARKINTDFGLGLDLNGGDLRADLSESLRKRQELERQRQQDRETWGKLCDVVHEANAVLPAYDAEGAWDDLDFRRVLEARSRADLALDVMWEVMKFERAG